MFANHFLWFRHFSYPTNADSSYTTYRPGGPRGTPYDYSTSNDPYFTERYPTFTEISSFFGICVWMVPFALFVSLSASDNVLPNSEIADGSIGGSGGFGGVGREKKNKGQGMAKMVFGSVKEYFSTSGEALGLWGPKHERFE